MLSGGCSSAATETTNNDFHSAIFGETITLFLSACFSFYTSSLSHTQRARETIRIPNTWRVLLFCVYLNNYARN